MAIISLDEYMAQQKKKKKNVITLEEYMESQGLSPTVATDDDIAPVKETKKSSGKEEQKNSYLQKGALEDGFSWKNAWKGARATKKDMQEDAVKGGLSGAEKVTDFFYMLGSAQAQANARKTVNDQILFDAIVKGEDNADVHYKTLDDTTKALKQDAMDFVAKDLIKEEEIAHNLVIAPYEERTGINVEENSFLGAKSDALVQSASEMLIKQGVNYIAPGMGTVLTIASAGGGQMQEAIDNDATFEEAVLSGIWSGGAEAISEEIFGGIKFGGKSLTDEVVKGIAKNIPNKFLQTLAKWGFDTAGEGLEEVFSYYLTSIGQNLTYLNEKEFNEIFTKEEAWENFVAGSIMGGMFGGASAVNSAVNPNAKDFVTGKSKDEQKVFDSIYEEAIANKEAEKGSKLTAKEKRELYNEIENSITKGYVSTDVIERVLGGKTYETYKQALDDENALKTEKDKLSSYKKRTNVQEQKLAEINERLGNSTTGDLKVQLSNEVFKRAKGTGLEESYRNLIRKGQKFEADLDSYTEENVKQTVKNFMEEYGGNNSNEAHDFLDYCINLIKGRDTVYRFMTTKQIEESIKNGNQYELREDIAPSRFQGFLHTGTNEIIINMDSGASFKSVIGHEITHTFDELGLESYNEMQKALFDYVGEEELARRREAKKGLYAEEQIDREVTADLVGEYITSDEKFVKQLAVENPNLFQRFLEGIKRLYKYATAGSEQARELERAKKMYEKAWRESQSANKNVATENAGTKNSISTEVDNVSDRLSASEWKRVQSAVAERKKLNYHYEKSSDGDIIIPINNKLVYTDANYDSPGISKVVEFDTEYEDEIDNARRLIYEAEKNKSEISDAYEVIEIFAGYEFINEYSQKSGEFTKKYDRRTSRGKSKSDTYHTNYLQERIRRAREIIHSVNGETSSEDGVFFDAENQSDIHYSIADSDGKRLTKGQQDYFKKSKVRDDNGNLKVMYHGTGRADRVGTVFDPNRATSGPMAYFTDSKVIAGNYARDKKDTSLAYDSDYDSYETQFRVTRNGKNMSVVDLWSTLSFKERNAILEKAKHITLDEDFENVIYDENSEYGLGNFDRYELNAHRGNALHTLVDSWLTDGNILGEEHKFLDVLKMVGIEDAEYKNPDYREEKVYEVYLNITNPFDTANVDESFLRDLTEYLENADLSKYDMEGNMADMWDKRNIAPDFFLTRLADDVENGTTHSWTAIPDYVTDFLKEQGYDGIVDSGGKNGGDSHQVAIPFYSEQIKDVNNENPTIDKDINYRIDDGYAFGEDSSPYTAENLKLRNQQEDIAPIIGWDASGSDTSLDGGSQREHISLEEYANSNSPVWRNVEYNDDQTKNTIMLETHKEMVASGEIVVVSDEVVNTVDKSYPDLRSMKKKDRNPILGEAIRKLKTDIQQFLGKFTEQKFEFEVNGKILDAKLYNTGIKEVVEKVTREKASMLYSTEEIFRNAQYLYSTRDYSDDTNVYRWNYFYTPVEINGQIVGVRIAVRDMVQGTNEMPESQIYNWGIKKDTSLDGGSPSPKVTSSDVSSDVSNNIIPQDTENTSDIFDDDFPIRDDIKQNRVDEAPIEVQTEEAPIREDFSTEQVAPVKEDSNNASQKQRKWVGTSTESDVVDGKVAIEDLDQDIIHYQPIPNSRTIGNANAKLESMGYDEALQYFNSQFHNRKIGLDDVALGERLLQEAVRKGDTETAHSLIQNISILGTELGQKVQALSIIKKAKPEGQLRMLEKIVERGKTKGDKVFDGVEVTKEMREHILSVYGKDGSYKQEDLDRAVEEVKQQIADQMGVTKLEKVNAWRMLSMLGNPKTHIRNLVSNVAMRGTLSVKNAIARTIETFAPIKNRTKTWKKPTDVVKSFAEKTTMEMKSEITGGGKYSDDASLKQMRDIFKNQILNGTYEFNSELLEKEDWWFSKPAFRDAFAEYLTANGVKTEQDIKKKPKIVAKAKAYALEQSQIATFRQYSYLANMIGELERKNTAMNIAVGSVLPFKKTPINIAKTGLNYSPLGFAKTLTYDISQMKKGNMEASEVIDHLAQNITGTGLSLVGFMLASMGLASGGGEDDKEGKYDYQLGEQRYALNIGGKSFSLSWLSPVAMPMFVGVNAYEQLVESKEWNGDLVMETLAKTLDPLSEMSFLSSLDDVLSSYDSGVEKFAGIGKSAMQSYVSQFVPTVSSQVATVLDDKKRTTKVGADSGFKMVEETINELKYKIPFLRETLEPSTDIWGNEIKQTENVLARSFETFIAPYSKKDNIATEIDDEIKSVYRETGESEVIPSVPNNYTNFKDEKYKMSAKEYTEYKKTYGQLANELMGDLFDTKTYKKATSEEKAQMIGYVYDYARDEAKKELLDKRGVEYTNATLDGVDYYQENAIKGAIEHDMPVDEYKFYRKNPKKHTFFTKELGITYKKYDNADEKTKDVYNWAFDNQEKYTVSKAIADDVVEYRSYAKALNDIKAGDKTKSLRIDYINSLPIDEGQAIILYRTYYDSKEDKRKYNGKILDYINSRDDLTYEERVTILEELDFTVYSDGRVEW